jgi:hypothetical protein
MNIYCTVCTYIFYLFFIRTVFIDLTNDIEIKATVCMVTYIHVILTLQTQIKNH